MLAQRFTHKASLLLLVVLRLAPNPWSGRNTQPSWFSDGDGHWEQWKKPFKEHALGTGDFRSAILSWKKRQMRPYLSGRAGVLEVIDQSDLGATGAGALILR